MSYTPTYKRPYEQWKELPSKETLVTAEVLTQYDDTFENIEGYLESEGKKEYALVTEAGYSIVASIDEYYVLTVVLKNKAGDALSTSEPIDLPIESMIINVDYDEESGILTFSLQNGQTLDVNISTLVRGLVPTSRKIAGVDLEDDITADELKDALGMYDEGLTAGTLKSWLYDTEKEVEIGVYNGKPLYRQVYVYEEVSIVGGMAYVTIDVENPEEIYIENAYAVAPDGGIWPIPYAHSNAVNNIGVFISSDYKGLNFRLGTAHEGTVIKACVILNYTKTTDLEGSGNNLNPYGIYDAKLDDVKSTIASVSDEVDAVNNKSRVAISLVNEKYADTLASMPNGQTAFGHRWSITSDSHPNDTQEGYHFYELYRGGSNYAKVVVTSEHGKWEGFWNQTNGLSWKHDYATNSRLAYKDISSSIDVGDSGCTATGYVENGQVVINIVIPNGTTAGTTLTLSADTSYAPRILTKGSFLPVNDTDIDNVKISWINGQGAIRIGVRTDLTAAGYVTFTYPLKTS